MPDEPILPDDEKPDPEIAAPDPWPEPDGYEEDETTGEAGVALLADEPFTQRIHHAISLILFLTAAYFTLWFLQSNNVGLFSGDVGLVSVFLSLWGSYGWAGGTMDWIALAWSIGAVVAFMVLGWFFLDTLELYLPYPVLAALAFLVGLALAGFLFEWLAIFHVLKRPWIFVAPGILIFVLWLFGKRAARRRPEADAAAKEGAVEARVRRQMARNYYRRSLISPRSRPERIFQLAALALIATISLLIFYHALFYPESYWDSLILYLGYARMMYLEQGIVEKVVGQVGIGLGANYPHLYALLGAAVSAAIGHWSELPQRLIAPAAGLASTLLVYHTALHQTRHVNFALAVTLLYRSIPLGIAFDQYASNYSLTILFVAAFLYLALLYTETALRGYLVLATLLIALAMHVNYLMGILWLPWAAMLVSAHVGIPSPDEGEELEREAELARALRSPVALKGWEEGHHTVPSWIQHRSPKHLTEILRSRAFLIALGSCVLIGSTWHLRNWIVTGNPVYAFFPGVFGGKNINPEVMESAVLEWSSNGAGIGRMGDDLVSRIKNSWQFFVDWRQAYRLQPFFTGFAVGGAIVLLGRCAAALLLRVKRSKGALIFANLDLRFGLSALLLVLSLFAFHYVLAPFYLYQIIMILPALAVLISFTFPYWRRGVWRHLLGGLVLTIGLIPGVAMALMGFKIPNSVILGPARIESQLGLYVFRHPLPEPHLMYRWRYGAESWMMFNYINGNLKGQRLLTHENRHLIFDPSIELIHLDDWEIQEIWTLTNAEKIEALKRIGIRYYLRVPMELSHPINARLGTGDWERMGLIEVEFGAGENVLYRLN